MFFAGHLFALKTGNAIGASLTRWLLELFGYQANVEQGSAALQGIIAIFAGSGVVGGLAGLAILQLYRLKRGWKDPVPA
jgi:Na+/melibiose symporter-like transporter